MEFEYLMDKADLVKTFKASYANQTKTLHRLLADTYGVKLIDMQNKHSELDKQLTHTTQQYDQSTKSSKDLLSFGQNMETNLKGQHSQKKTSYRH